MGMGLEYWRKFFRTSRSSIIEVIENAILVANKDCPADLVNHRDCLVMKLYSSASSSRSCYGCSTSHLDPPFFNDEKCVEKEMLEDDEDEDFDEDYNNDYMTNAMAIENQKYAEVMEMKEILQRTESDTEILQSLKRLLHIGISYTTLEKSKIGIAVNKLRKHKLSEVRNSAKNLIQKWKDLVDRWVEENESVGIKDISKETPDSIIDEEGVCCPAVDDGRVPMETQAASVKDSTMKSCDCLNDDQNAQDCDKKKQENRQTEILNKGSSSMRFRIPLQKYKLSRPQDCSDDTTVNTTLPTTDSDNKPKMLHDDPAHQAKLETTRKRLNEGYLQHNDAKKQKTIQLVDLPPLPPKQRNTTQRRPVQNNVNSPKRRKTGERRLVRPNPGNIGKKLKKLLRDR